jgi:hypothetical protein
MPSLALLLNGTSTALQVSVNNGDPFPIAGTDGSKNWQPQQPTPNPVSFEQGYPAPNRFGSYGANQMTVMSGAQRFDLYIQMPQVRINSLQLYLFGGNNGMFWVMLADGVNIASGTSPLNASAPAPDDTRSEK